MDILLISRLLNTSLSQLILLPVLAEQIKSQEKNNKNEDTIADEMYGESDEIAGCVPFEEYLWA
jgi:hypothetical protein